MSDTAGVEAATAPSPDLTVEDFDLIASLDVGKAGEEDGGDEPPAKDGDGAGDESTEADEEGKTGKPVAAPKKSADTESKWFDDAIEDDDLRKLAGEFDSRDELLEAITDIQKALGIEPIRDWRQSITDEKLRDHSGRFNSPTELAKAHLDLRQQLSAALVPPGKNATKEERVAFAERLAKVMGVPEKPEDYAFPTPPEGKERTDAEQASQEGWAKFFHEIHLPKQMADSIITKFAEETEAGRVALEKTDDRYAEATEAELQGEWGDEYDINHRIAVRTAKELFGDDLDNVMQTQMSNGRLLMDSTFMLRMLAHIGREMSEGSLESLSEAERDTLDDQVRDVRKRAAEAKGRGETRLANKLFKEEQALLSKIVGRQPIIGAGGRNA